MEVKLVVLEGKAKGREIPLPSTQFIIGRATDCHLRPHSPMVSKYHCAIGRSAGHVLVRDLNSRNGTFLNNVQLTKAMRVKDGDTLSVGPLRFRFSVEGGTSPVQAIREDHVRWLIDADDSFEMDSNYETQIVELPPHLLEGADAAAEQGHHELSAGKFLKEYFQPKRNDTDNSR